MAQAEPRSGPQADEHDLFIADESLHREADELLQDRGLLAILARFGVPKPVGSYVLHLMTYRDLDLYLIRETLDLPAFFGLGAEIVTRLRPHRLQFRNEIDFCTPGLPRGLYWGVYTSDEPARAWKVDIWAMDAIKERRLSETQETIASRLDREARRTILAIKSQLCTAPNTARSTAVSTSIVQCAMPACRTWKGSRNIWRSAHPIDLSGGDSGASALRRTPDAVRPS